MLRTGKSTRETKVVTDDTSSAARNEVAGPWLSPSEALTRYVPGPETRRAEARAVAPIRFGFRVGDIGLLVPAGMISELVEELEIYPLPTTPVWFPGLINLRGCLVPVFDLKKLFDLEDPGGEKPNLLVLDAGVDAVGVFIDGLPLTLDTGKRVKQTPPLPEILRTHSQAVYMRESNLWVDFDFDGFFRAVGSRIAA